MSLSPTTESSFSGPSPLNQIGEKPRRCGKWRAGAAMACLLLLCAGAPHAQAGSLTVMPVGVHLLAPERVRESLRVTNNGEESMTVQADVVAWRQVDGLDEYTPTPDVLLNPAIFDVEPGKTQVLRLGWRGQQGETEQAYRLILREVPRRASSPRASAPVSIMKAAPGNAVQVLLELRIPIYVAPADAGDAPVWQAKRVDGDAVEVTLDNRSRVHTVVHEVNVSAETAEQPVLGTRGVHAAVLAGQRRRWVMDLPKDAKGDLAVWVQVDQQRLRLPLQR